MSAPRVAILMGSLSDLDVMMNGIKVLQAYGIEYEVHVLSAHRAPDAVGEFAKGAADRGVKLLIGAAGGAAHLAGALAAQREFLPGHRRRRRWPRRGGRLSLPPHFGGFKVHLYSRARSGHPARVQREFLAGSLR